MNKKELTVFAMEQILEYAKYLEDNGSLTYKLLKQRVETYKGENVMGNTKTVASYGDVEIFMDGKSYCAVHRPTFINLQESPAGFGDTESEAIANLVLDQVKHFQKDLKAV